MHWMMDELGNVLPPHLLPLAAPLSHPMVQRLLLQEAGRYRRRRPEKRPRSEQIRKRVFERIAKERAAVFEYMDVFVRAERMEQKHTFPENEWILEVLAARTPHHVTNSVESLNFWRKKRVLRRSDSGPFTLTSVAALLIARYACTELQRNWLPERIAEHEPEWWGLAVTCPKSLPVPVAYPFPDDLPPTTLLWTPWPGVLWEGKEWIQSQDGALRFARAFTTLEQIACWDENLAHEIGKETSCLLNRPSVRSVLFGEARILILEHLAQHSFPLPVEHEGTRS